MYGLIYQIRNVQNNKIYIGQTIHTLENRIKGHIKHASQNKPQLICRAIHKYGIKNFKWFVLGYCNSKKELDEAEIICIEHFQSNDRQYGYNLTNGGDGPNGYKHSYNAKMKISKKSKENWGSSKYRDKIIPKIKANFVNKKDKMIKASQTTEARKKRSQSHFGKKLSKETIEKMHLWHKTHGRTGGRSKVDIPEQKLIIMLNEKIPLKEIAANFNVSKSTIRNRLNEIKKRINF